MHLSLEMNYPLNSKILAEVANYYADKLDLHGATPRGVDWNSAEGQLLRFDQLDKIIDRVWGFSCNDIGCGYGALLDYLHQKYSSFSYLGVDVSADMIRAACQQHEGDQQARFITASLPGQVADYSIASGIFNVRLHFDDDEWMEYILYVIDNMNRLSRIGFAFNCLTSYSDEHLKRDNLYYADPCYLFDLCKRLYSKNVSLLHDYSLYEFTILVRKSL